MSGSTFNNNLIILFNHILMLGSAVPENGSRHGELHDGPEPENGGHAGS